MYFSFPYDDLTPVIWSLVVHGLLVFKTFVSLGVVILHWHPMVDVLGAQRGHMSKVDLSSYWFFPSCIKIKSVSKIKAIWLSIIQIVLKKSKIVYVSNLHNLSCTTDSEWTKYYLVRVLALTWIFQKYFKHLNNWHHHHLNIPCVSSTVQHSLGRDVK